VGGGPHRLHVLLAFEGPRSRHGRGA
jgi:hypothetical protein